MDGGIGLRRRIGTTVTRQHASQHFGKMSGVCVAQVHHVQIAGSRLGGVNAQYQVACQRSEEHTSELQSLMRISYAVFCLKKKNPKHKYISTPTQHPHSKTTTRR